MGFKFEQAGSVTVTNGSLNVAGTGTAWLVDYAGLAINIDGLTYPVAAITSQTTLTLAKPYPGETATGLAYTFMPLQAENYALARDVNFLLQNGGVQIGKSAYDLAVEAGFVGTEAEWLDSLNGVDGRDAQVQMQAVVDLSQFAGQVAGSKGVKLIVPVESGDPGIALTQQAQVVIPNGSTNAGIGIWARSTASGLALLVGLTNVPLPQPENPTTPGTPGSGGSGNLSGASTFYAPFNAITPLGIKLGAVTGALTLSRNFTDTDLKIRRKTETPMVVAKTAQWTTGSSGSPYPVAGDAFGSAMVLQKRGTGTSSFRNGHVVLNKDSYLITPALGIELASSSDAVSTQTPPSLRLRFKGVVPAGSGKSVLIGSLLNGGGGEMSHKVHWSSSSIEFYVGRDGGGSATVFSDDASAALTGANHLIESEWVDNPATTGGTVTFYVDGVKLGASKVTEFKPRITPAASFEVNSSVENTSNSVANLEVEYVGIVLGQPGVATTYMTISDGTVSTDDLENLVVDATGITTQQTERVLSYSQGSQRYDLTLVVGEMILPAGRPYKAVLEDWSTGAGVPHANELVMTKPAAQNCRFEDATLHGLQGSWTEVVPQGAAPVIDGIRYAVEGIRQGSYVMLQFVYALDRASEPFGDPTGLETYMRPHKWLIYDSAGTLLQRIEQPSGQPLNSTNTKAIWEGQYDGRSVPKITDSNRWYPHGTVRSSVIYRNGTPPAYPQATVYNNVPVYDLRVPFASHTGYSVNGFDLRLNAGGAGGDGQCNGFANWQIMPVNCKRAFRSTLLPEAVQPS